MKTAKDYHIFWGGEDVHPMYYNRSRSKYAGQHNIIRDEEEISLAVKLIQDGIPLIGICRGAQLLNVVNGGTLCQHIENHGRDHWVYTTVDNPIEGYEKLWVTSTHHQMMQPGPTGIVLAKDIVSTFGVDYPEDKLVEIPEVNEVIYYPDTNCLCIQPHPEWMDQSEPFIHWINELIHRYFKLPPIDFKEEGRKAGWV